MASISPLVNAQLSSAYTFTQTSGTFTSLTSGTVVADGNAMDDEVSGPITIPSFTFNGVAYTQLYITVNGFVTFGSAPAGTNYTPLSSTAGYAGAIAPFGTNVAARAGAANIIKDVRYAQVGNEFVVEWRNVRRNSVSEAFSFQLRLNTSTNVIRLRAEPRNTWNFTGLAA